MGILRYVWRNLTMLWELLYRAWLINCIAGSGSNCDVYGPTIQKTPLKPSNGIIIVVYSYRYLLNSIIIIAMFIVFGVKHLEEILDICKDTSSFIIDSCTHCYISQSYTRLLDVIHLQAHPYLWYTTFIF